MEARERAEGRKKKGAFFMFPKEDFLRLRPITLPSSPGALDLGLLGDTKVIN